MRTVNFLRKGWSAALLVTLGLLASAQARAQQTTPFREPADDVKDQRIRQLQGLTPGKNLLFNGWGITPAGTHVPISDMALKLVVSPDKKMLLAACAGYNNTGLRLVDIKDRKVTQFLPVRKIWNGLAFSLDGRRIFVSGGDYGRIHTFDYSKQTATPSKSVKPATNSSPVFLAGLAVHPVTGKVYVCNEANAEIWILNADTLALEDTIPVGEYPHSCAFGADKRHLYVSNWGGRSVSLIDTATNRRLRNITVGIRPNDLALAPDGRLFVACAGDNTVHVIQTQSLEKPDLQPNRQRRVSEVAREIICTSLYPDSPEGSSPSGLAVSPDGKTLFVANSDNNSVMVVDISNALSDEARHNRESVSVANGFIPVGWYPTAVCVSPDNQTLFVANGKGLTSKPNYPPKATSRSRRVPSVAFDHVARLFEGSVSFIARPNPAMMAAYTQQVRRNSPYTPDALRRAAVPAGSLIPQRPGQSCPIKYVLYVIKENRTYDQVFGDMKDASGRPIGNGDPNLTIYGENVTPNQHQLARDYVLLDNLYCNGDVSADGHSWCDAAIATDFNQRSWVMSYSGHGVLPGNAELEQPSAGYLWDLCQRHGITYKCYGEGARHVPSGNRGTWRGGRDYEKVQGWIEDLKKAEKTGKLPRFMIMSLGENHTRGTTPGAYTPDAMVASNDLGLARLIEAASKSKFWKEMAIFVIEDDAQNGPDHVDAHRTAGLVISPYSKRGVVDSTLYTTASMVRTMELILGLPPLTQYDAGATPMYNCFTTNAVLTPFTPLPPQVNLLAKNTGKSPGAKESARMNFREYDRAPEDALNRILWAVAKGPDEPYPVPVHRVLFTQPIASAANE